MPDDGWSWFEDELSYDNARLSQALISGAHALGRDDLAELGLDSLRWLGDESGLDGGVLRLAGHRGRRRDEPVHGSGDEQPLDAAALVEAELAAYAVTRDPEHGAQGDHAPSSGSWDATACRSRSTTSPPAAAATGSAARR